MGWDQFRSTVSQVSSQLLVGWTVSIIDGVVGLGLATRMSGTS